MTALASNGCQSRCDWGPTGTLHDALPLFRCSGCATEWVRTQRWTPRQADNTLDPRVAAEAARRSTPSTLG